MRCYFMRDGHIASVELLDQLSDEQAIAAAGQRFLVRVREGFDGFEVWDRERRVFRYPEGDNADPHSRGGDGGRSNGKPLSGGPKKEVRRPSRPDLRLTDSGVVRASDTPSSLERFY